MLEPPLTLDGFQRLVESELRKARIKHPGKQHSLHEGYGVLLEEVDEFWLEVKKRSSKRDHANILTELVQIAAMAQRTAEDLGYVLGPDAAVSALIDPAVVGCIRSISTAPEPLERRKRIRTVPKL